jgi:tetratricopeptide (TPR) repeat protein
MNIEESKKNPKLGPAKFGVNLPFMTPFDFVFGDDRPMSRKMAASREKFLAYPKHLKATLFLEDPKLNKIRGIEFMQRYMVIDEIREQGNECFFKANYDKAIGTYTTAYACLKWLEYKDPVEEETKEESTHDESVLENSLKKINEITSELSEEMQSKVKIDLNSIAEKSFNLHKAKSNKLKDPKLRKLTAVFDDDNTELKMDTNLACEQDLQMRDNQLFGILVNLGTAYMMACHFDEALLCFEEAHSLQPSNSILFFRWSQALSYNELASLDRLQHSQELIRKAMECYAREKIFKEQGKLVLKMLNIHNAAEAYEYQRGFVDSQLRHKETEAVTAIAEILEVAADRCTIEDELISEGRLPASRLDNYLRFKPEMEEEDERCFLVTKKLLAKCKDLIVFNVETMNEAQLVLAKTEYAKVAKILGRLIFLKDLPIEKGDLLCDQAAAKTGVNIDVRVQHKAWKVKLELISEAYGKADFNYQLFTAALQDHFADEKKKQAKKKNEKERSENTLDSDLKARPLGLSPAMSCAFYLSSLLMIVAFFLVTVRYLTGSHVNLYNLGGLTQPSPSLN